MTPFDYLFLSEETNTHANTFNPYEYEWIGRSEISRQYKSFCLISQLYWLVYNNLLAYRQNSQTTAENVSNIILAWRHLNQNKKRDFPCFFYLNYYFSDHFCVRLSAFSPSLSKQDHESHCTFQLLPGRGYLGNHHHMQGLGADHSECRWGGEALQAFRSTTFSKRIAQFPTYFPHLEIIALQWWGNFLYTCTFFCLSKCPILQWFIEALVQGHQLADCVLDKGPDDQTGEKYWIWGEKSWPRSATLIFFFLNIFSRSSVAGKKKGRD